MGYEEGGRGGGAGEERELCKREEGAVQERRGGRPREKREPAKREEGADLEGRGSTTGKEREQAKECESAVQRARRPVAHINYRPLTPLSLTARSLLLIITSATPPT